MSNKQVWRVLGSFSFLFLYGEGLAKGLQKNFLGRLPSTGGGGAGGVDRPN